MTNPRITLQKLFTFYNFWQRYLRRNKSFYFVVVLRKKQNNQNLLKFGHFVVAQLVGRTIASNIRGLWFE